MGFGQLFGFQWITDKLNAGIISSANAVTWGCLWFYIMGCDVCLPLAFSGVFVLLAMPIILIPVLRLNIIPIIGKT